MFRDNEEDESLKKNNPVVHYRFKRKIEFLNCHLQLYVAEDKIKFIVNCIEDYSEEFKEYSNDFSLYQFQELSKYFNFFEKIEDILEDLASILKLDNYDIEKNSNIMTVILHVSINEEFGDVNLTLFRKKTNNNNSYKKPSQIVQSINNSDNRKRIVHKSRNNNVEADGSGSGTNVGVKSIRELNNLLTELKDRITVLEVTQNTSQNPPMKNKGIFSNNLPTSEKLFSLGSSSLVGNENVLLNMDSIIKRINKLEEANTKKTEKIKYLEEKLKIYDPMFTASETDSLNDNNFNFNNVNYNYINLGSIKKKDTNTINSNNTNLNNTLLEIKEELNSSSSSKHRNKSKNKGINNKDNNVHESDKKNKSKIKEKKHKSKSKSKNKNKKMQEKESPKPNKKIINYNNNNNKDNNEVFIDKENNYNNKQNKSSRRKSKSRNNDKIKEKNLKNKEEIICTDIKEPKNRQSNLRKIVHEVDEKDSEKLINNLEKYLNNNKNKNKDKDKEQNVNENDIKRNSSFNKDNNEIGYSNDIEKKNTRNYDNNNNVNDNYDNDNNIINNNVNNVNNNINNVNNIENNDNNIENNNNNINNQYDNNTNNINNHYDSNNNKDIEKKDENSNKTKSIDEENRREENKRRENKKENKESESNDNSIEIIKKNEKQNKKKKILPIVEKERIKKYVNSEIIFTKKELRLLKTKINDGNKNLHVFFDLLYRATEDGDNADIIKKKIKDIHKTLTLFYTEEGARFGIYIEKEIRYSIFGKSLKEKEGTSFLISLNNCIIYDILGENIATENKGDMLCFIKNKQKNKNGSGWAIFTPPKEFLGKLCILGDVTYVFDIEDNDEIIGDKNEYHLKEVEIFEVAIEEGDDYNNYEGGENIKIKMNNISQNDTNENNISNNKSNDTKDEKKKVEYTISTSENNYSNNINNKDKNNPSNDDKDDNNNEFYLSGIIKGIHDK